MFNKIGSILKSVIELIEPITIKGNSKIKSIECNKMEDENYVCELYLHTGHKLSVTCKNKDFISSFIVEDLSANTIYYDCKDISRQTAIEILKEII